LWKASPIPSDFKLVETKAALEKLENQCEDLKKAVDNKDDNERLKRLTGK
jgi:hypothetical protein